LALLSKETAIVFPALAVACLFLLRSGRWNWRSYTVTGPLWAMAGLYLLARKTVLNFDNTFQFYKTANIYTEHILYRFFTFLATLPSYFGLLLWPQHLHMDREFPVFVDMASLAVLLGAALLAAGVAALWWERRSTRPIVSFAVLWFLAAHVPHSGVLLPVNSMFLEHWLYLPSVGFFLSFGETATTWSLGRRIAFPLALAIAAIFGVVTFRQNRIWRTPVSFYSNILKYETKVARVHNNLAMAFSDEGDNDGAIVEYEKAIEISDTYPQSHHNLGLALIRKGDVDGAIRHLKRALELDPDFYYSSGILAQIYHQMGNDPQADEYSRRYVESIQKFRH
jgi:tetratricopeptide (TPR) repeat protein